MPTYTRLIHALQTGMITSKDVISYNPSSERALKQDSCEIKNEFGLRWHPVIYKPDCILLIAEPTDTKWTSASTCVPFKFFEAFAKLYENDRLHSIGAIPTPELLRLIPDSLKSEDVWTYIPPKTGSHSNFVKVYCHNRYIPTETSQEIYSKSMQPIVFLPINTVVEISSLSDDGSCAGHEFKLLPGKV